MPKDDSLRDLIERVEAASEGSRELDDEIAFAVSAMGQKVPCGHTFNRITGHKSGIAARHYTTSIDAAMTLLPEGWWHGYMTSEGGFDAHCFEQVVDSAIFRATAATPALALCCASLRAHMGTGG